MAKFLIQAVYTAEGLQRLLKDGGAGRLSELKKAVASVGGNLDHLFWTLGEHDAILIVDVPDAECAAAIGIAASATGHARTTTTRLLSAAGIDRSLAKIVKSRAENEKR